MKKIYTLLLLFTLVGFLSGNQVIITNDYQYIITTEATYNFSNGTPSNNVKYDRTNKIQIQNNKVIANPLNYHYAFFWDESNAFIGYYKTNKGIATNGPYLGQVNTQSIPLPLNAYSFALVRYDDDYVLVNGFTIEDLFIDNNLAGVDPDDFNDIPIAELNNNSLNDIFNRTLLKTITALPNGVKYYEISGGNIVQRVQQYVIQSSDIVGLVTTDYTTMDVAFTNPSFLGITTVGVSHAQYGGATINPPADNVSNIGKNFLGGGRLRFTFAKPTTLAQAKTALSGTAILYQLGTPITILSGVSINQAALDTYYQIWLNGVNATYYATDGNVSSVDGYYYAAGKNLLDINDTTINFYVDYSSGNLFANNNYVVSNFINIKNLTYYFTNANLNIAFYDSSFTYISTTLGTGSDLSFFKLAPNNSKYVRVSILKNQIINGVQVEQGSTATTYEAFATPTTTLNLTFLFGVGNEPNKTTMDGYYQDYEDWQDYSFILPLGFNTQTISFETIYFDDGVSTEIEQLGSILIFTLIGFTLMIFGFASKRRIFNLLAVGAFVVLGFLLIEFVGFIIILFGLIFVNVYYTFFGEL
jgi:hypothetical protein